MFSYELADAMERLMHEKDCEYASYSHVAPADNNIDSKVP
jgi:hypothetical protein